jgi:Hemerythrin HHE cation binding domain
VQPLERVVRAHHEQLSRCAERLHVLASDLDGPPLLARVPELRDAHHELATVLLPHLDAAEVTVHRLLMGLVGDGAPASTLTAEHAELRRLVALLGDATAHPEGWTYHTGPLGLQRSMLCLADLLAAHLVEEERCLAQLEDRLTPGQAAAVARALDHVVERL